MMSVVAAFLAGAAPDEDEIITSSGLEAADWIRAGVIVAGALLLGIILYEVVLRVVRADSASRLGVARLLARLAGMVIFLVGVVYALNGLGVRIAPLLGALGIAGIAIAFALQNILENFIASIILHTRYPFRHGDQVVSDEWEGTVEDINFRSVVLRTVDGTRVFLPSASVLRAPIHNLTAFSIRRTTVMVGVAYGTDLRLASQVIGEAVAGVDEVADNPQPETLVEQFGESSVDFAVRFWHRPDIATMWRVRDQVLMAVYEALGKAEITIPFPQSTISYLDTDG